MQYPMDFWFSGLEGDETTKPTHSGLPRSYLKALGEAGTIDFGLESKDPHEFAMGALMGIAHQTDNLPPSSEAVPVIAEELQKRFSLPKVKAKEIAMEAYRIAESHILGPQFRRN